MIAVDLDIIAANATPPRLRSYEWMSLIHVMNTPFKHSLNAFYALYEQKRYEIAFNGQVMNLEHVLNDYFDNILRRIRIADYSVTPLYLFNLAEDNEVTYLFNSDEVADPVYLNNQEEASGLFIIYVPIGQITNYNLFNSIATKYKLKGKTYQIIEE